MAPRPFRCGVTLSSRRGGWFPRPGLLAYDGWTLVGSPTAPCAAANQSVAHHAPSIHFLRRRRFLMGTRSVNTGTVACRTTRSELPTVRLGEAPGCRQRNGRLLGEVVGNQD